MCRIKGKSPKLWESQIHLIRARNSKHAFKLANQIGKKENLKYKNSKGETVVWKYVGLGELSESLFDEVKSGVEIHSMFTRGKKSPQVLPKNRLEVFWMEKNKNKTAGELLHKSVKRFAPK